jgi:hypothetical protein
LLVSRGLVWLAGPGAVEEDRGGGGGSVFESGLALARELDRGSEDAGEQLEEDSDRQVASDLAALDSTFEDGTAPRRTDRSESRWWAAASRLPTQTRSRSVVAAMPISIGS